MPSQTEPAKAPSCGVPVSTTPAGRLAIADELMRPRIHDDDGNVIGYGEPLISAEDLLKLLSVGAE